jgi:AcrR family transcriptional regulator
MPVNNLAPIAKKQRPGTAAYANGQITAANILQTAKRIVIDDGMSQLTLRRIAREMDMSPGNLSYYYATKNDLMEDLFMHVLAPFLAEFERLRKLRADSPEAQLRAVLNFVFDDLATRETTMFFPEMWVMALRDAWAAEKMERVYHTYRSVLVDIIAAMRPDLDAGTHDDLALTLSASVEGHTVFVGHGRSHQSRAAFVKPLIVEQLVKLVSQAGKKPAKQTAAAS